MPAELLLTPSVADPVDLKCLSHIEHLRSTARQTPCLKQLEIVLDSPGADGLQEGSSQQCAQHLNLYASGLGSCIDHSFL